MKNKYTIAIIGLSMVFLNKAQAQTTESPVYKNPPPVVSEITSTSVTLSVPQDTLKTFSSIEQKNIYFKYTETEKVCIAIYPTPPECLPRETKKGQTSVQITDLKPNTKYTAWYMKDSTIMCITTPCPTNEIESMSTEFTTKSQVLSQKGFTKNLWYGLSNSDVKNLQDFLSQKGYMNYKSTGYFGSMTSSAVKLFQKEIGVIQTGFVGPLTRGAINKMLTISSIKGEYFEGVVDSYSTGCYVDGECSITVSGRKIVTTIGRSQDIVGQVKGVESIDSIKIGSLAKVYAQKTLDGYTLYGDANYYVEIK